MAALSTALNYARSSLVAVSGQTAVASQNVANAKNTDYSRKTALISSQSSGSIAISGYDRAADSVLLEKLLSSSSNSAASNAILDGVKQLSETVGDPQSNTSPSAMLVKFQNALQVYEQNPADQNLAANSLQAASDLIRTLNAANSTIQNVRKQADTGIADSVSTINNLLKQYKVVNDAIVRAGNSSSETADNLDTRDKIIQQLSDLTGIKTVTRANNDVALYTESGVTLFETNPRTVSFSASANMTAAIAGSAVYIDGVDITGSSSSMPLQSGRIFGLVKIRDNITVTYQSQMDELSRGLIEAFAEAPQVPGSTLPSATGLFTYSGSPTIPASAVSILGLSGEIKLNATADPLQGGNVTKLRDGGMNGASYSYNTTAAAGYSDRISGLIKAIDSNRNFDPSASIATQSNLKTYGLSSAGWLSSLLQKSTSAAELQTATSQRSANALQSKTGVNIDEEMATMLQLERSYQASAKLISTVDQMLQTLLSVVK